MKLLPRYSLFSGLKIGRQHLLEQFFPLPFVNYITLHAASGMQGKNYPHFATVVELIKPYLATRGIEIVQLGVREDPGINGCYQTMGKTSLHQANYLVTRAKLHLGNDSIWAHRAGYLGIPLVETFSTTSVENHAPYHFNAAKTRFISSHRWGRKPTFAAQEQQSTANLICPFSVARAVLELLDIPHTLNQSTVNVGGAFNAGLLELVPNCVPAAEFNAHLPMAVRYDLLPNESILAQVLQTGRKINLLAKTPIPLNLIAAFKGQLLSLNYEMDEITPLDYVAALKKLVPNTTFFTRNPDAAQVAALRFRFFDIVNIQQVVDKTKADFEKACREYVNDPSFSLDSALNTGKLEFKTNKYVLSNGKIYLSLAHEKADVPVGALGANAVRDEDVYWHDQNHFLVYLTRPN